MPEPSLLPLSSDLFVYFMRLARRARVESSDEVVPRHYAVLAQLKTGPSTARQLADVERVSAPAMTRTLNTLEQLGYVRREPDTTDGRRTSVAITPAGVAARIGHPVLRWGHDRVVDATVDGFRRHLDEGRAG